MPGVLPLPKDDYLAAHIPGAVFFDVDAMSDHSNPLPHMYPIAEQFARDVGALGISSDDTVVLYDSGGWVAAPRAWWMFLSFGHPDVRVLDGGLKKWVRGRPHGRDRRGDAEAREIPGELRSAAVRSKQQLVGNLASRAEQVVDARASAALRGQGGRAAAGPPLRPYPGQPQRALQRTVRCRDRRDEAAGRVAGGVSRAPASKLDAPIVTSCGSGVAALVLTLALYRLGVREPGAL